MKAVFEAGCQPA